MKHKKLIIFIAFVILFITLEMILGITEIIADHRNIVNLANKNIGFTIAIYIAITIIGCVLFAVPGVTFAVLAGFFFTPWLGVVLCTIACTAGASISFLAGRYFLRDSVQPLVMKNKYIRKYIIESKSKSEVYMLMITRIIPIFPFNLQNFAYGITNISFWKYTALTFIFMIPGVTLFTLGTIQFI